MKNYIIFYIISYELETMNSVTVNMEKCNQDPLRTFKY
jgi:hypothetical protein